MRAKKKPQGRPRGSKNVVKRVKRQLTAMQKLREHVLIELNLDKQDIADAIGTTRQTVSNLFLDAHRSELEEDVIAFLRVKYMGADLMTAWNIDGYFHWFAFSTDPDGCPITATNFGWPTKGA